MAHLRMAQLNRRYGALHPVRRVRPEPGEAGPPDV